MIKHEIIVDVLSIDLLKTEVGHSPGNQGGGVDEKSGGNVIVLQIF